MLRISKLTDYATIILSYLALEKGVQSAARIAKAVSLSVPTVSKVLKILAEAKLLQAQRGMEGGYILARSAINITLAEIVSAMEGPVAMTECCSTESHCTITQLCTLKDNWQHLNQKLLDVLEEVSLEAMLQPLQTQKPQLKGIPIRVTG